jgi:flagellar biosynthesis protein FlhF
MNLKRFTARTSREALALVREAFGDDAVVMSTKPCADGVEMLAMAPESLRDLERVSAAAAAVPPRASPPRAPRAAQPPAAVQRPPAPAVRGGDRVEPRLDAAPRERNPLQQQLQHEVEQDVEQLQMSTLSFQDYVRERMLKRRRAEMAADAAASEAPARPAPSVVAPIEAARARLVAAHREPPVLREEIQLADHPALQAAAPITPFAPRSAAQAAQGAQGPALAQQAAAAVSVLAPTPQPATHGEQVEMLSELRSMRGLIEQRFGALAFMEKLQRQPRQAQLSQRLLDAGFSPGLIRKLVESLPADTDEMQWAAGVLERNLPTGEREAPLEDLGGVFALVGTTGVGKTTSTAKLAAAFATRHGAAHLGLITLDAYRVGAHEQLRTYGRILGVPVHTAHDRASLEDLLDLLSAKKMVLIDTAGMAQRDTRTRELLEMLSHRSIHRLLVVNSASQGETIEDQLVAYAAPTCRGVILSKLDEAVKLGPALDSMVRHRLKVVAVANGQRVPEDWHRLSAHALVQRALKSAGGPAWRLDGSDVSLIFAGLPTTQGMAAMAAMQPARA